MEISIDMLNLNNADSFIIWIKYDDGYDYVIFLDGGCKKDSSSILQHFETFIKPYLPKQHKIVIINSHPHDDHIGGLLDLIDYLGSSVTRIYYNNPKNYIDKKGYQILKEYYDKHEIINRELVKLYESMENITELESRIRKHTGIQVLPIFSDIDTKQNLFKVIGPSTSFYSTKLKFFGNENNLKNLLEVKLPESIVNEALETVLPCSVVDAVNDDSAENLTSTILEFQDSKNRKFLFTSDSGVDSFESAKSDSLLSDKYFMVQLPHHGSRRNINSNWIKAFSPNQFWISAIGDKKHPRKAVIECIKKNCLNTLIYSTHRGGTKNWVSVENLFPPRVDWSPAEHL